MNNPGGVRMSTALTYLKPCRHRLNLTVRPNVLARRIRFEGKQATGIEVESNDQSFVVEGEEIILSSGAIASPQLLLLSGVGPAEDLRLLGINSIHDLTGVGRNMKNHPLCLNRVPLAAGAPTGVRRAEESGGAAVHCQRLLRPQRHSAPAHYFLPGELRGAQH